LSTVVTDESAVNACLRFLDDQRVLVEPACGASLAAVYEGAAELEGFDSVLVVVCGGVTTTLDKLEGWSQEWA
jgi:L-serine/L-threonine ammonia-lyase